MANNQTITATLQLQDPGNTVEKGTRSLEKLNAQNDKLERSTKRRSVAAGMSERADYNTSRAVGQGTGASARDFAKESQGLGGLVRLYATLAANLFAAEAAFRALKSAADLQNMITGLDQMGASTGQALGAMSKRFAETTGFAISLRDSVEAVSKASSAGLNQKQILGIAEVAKKASQTLGVDMNDAVSRLTRGITKQEPELLDELGIFTKLGKATEDYAARLGKPVSALTEFQRTQAFANAVLAEGNKKFSDINIPTNPYDKLLASLANLATTGSNIVNYFLKPIAEVLASNPTALVVAVTALGAAIFKQFLPAVSELRKGARDEANRLADVANERAKEAKESFNKTQEYRKKALAAEYNDIEQLNATKIAAADATLKKISKGGMSKEARKITDPTREISTITEKELKYMEALGAKNTKVAGQYRAWAEAVREAHLIAQTEAKRTAEYNDKINKPPGSMTTAGIQALRAENARKSAASKNITATAADIAATESLAAGVKSLTTGIKTEKLGLFAGAFTAIAGGAQILGVALGNLVTFFTKFLGYVGIAISIWEAFDAVLGKGQASLDNLKSKTEQLTDVTKTATDVSKKYGETLSVASINAKATAITNLVDALDEIAPALDKAMTETSAWTRFFDRWLPEFLGGQVINNMGTAYATAITKSLDLAVTSDAKKDAEQKLGSLLDIDPKNLNTKSIEDALLKAGAGTRAKAKGIIDQLKKDTQSINDPLQKVQDGFANLDKAYLALNNSFINNDVGSQFAVALIGQLNNLDKAFENPTTRVATLLKISKDLSVVQMFPPETQKQLVDAAKTAGELTTKIEESEKAMKSAQSKIDLVNKWQGRGTTLSQERAIEIKVEGERELQAATKVHEESTKKLQEVNTNLRGALATGMTTAIGVLQAPLSAAIAQASINSQKTALSAIPRTLQTVDLNAKLELQSIAVRKQEILALYTLAKSFDLERLDRKKTDLQEKQDKARASNDYAAIGETQKQINIITEQERAYNTKNYAKEFGTGMSEEVAGIISRRIGLDTKIAALSGEAEQVRIKQITDSVAVSFEQASKTRQDTLDVLTKQNTAERQTPAFLAMSPAQQANRQAEQAANEKYLQDQGTLMEVAKLKATAGMLLSDALLMKNKGLTDAFTEAIDLSDIDIANKQKSIKYSNEQIVLESARKASALEYVSATKAENLQLDKIAGTQQNALTLAQSNNDFAKNKLDFEQQFNALTLDEYANKVRILEIDNAGIERDRARIDQQRNYNKALQDLVAKQIENGTIQQDDAEIERRDLANNNALALANIDQQYQGRVRLADLEKSRQDYNGKREQEYAKAFERSMDGMIDSFINFAKTGKFSFKDMANAIIQDIARIEIRMQLMQFAAESGGFLNMARMFLGFSGTASATGSIASAAGGGSYVLSSAGVKLGGFGNAKGGVYDAGVKQFAKGGTFTNSIVNSPTMFKFSKGTGLMGEAGPEAIMPLKRDGNGNLGVRTNQQQQKVEVVVNNFGTEKATTKETVNNRGERKIEVIIGDAVAGELSRPGSAVQQSFSSNFGAKPAVARR